MGKPINSSATYQWLEQGRRLHLQHGPIDLIVEAVGDPESVALAYRQAHVAFQSVLSGLVEELPVLRQALLEHSVAPEGDVAKRMYDAAVVHRQWSFVTPMIAVAGSVADHVLQAMLHGCNLSRAYVNNGGDIALWLGCDESFTVGICDNTETAQVASRITLRADDGIQGVATSGWRGRSHSLGIADAVTVLAESAATADAAATIIANAVDVPECSRVSRTPAAMLSTDSDLGEQLVTVAVARLQQWDIDTALENGRRLADELISLGLVESAYISLQGNHRVCLQQAICAGAMHA